jgi:hypothetical protein
MENLSRSGLVRKVVYLVLIFLLLTSNKAFAEKLQFGVFSLENNPVNIKTDEKLKISGTVYYFTVAEDPKPISINITVADEIKLPVKLTLSDKRVIDQGTGKKMIEWDFSAIWDGKVPFAMESSAVYECKVEVTCESPEVSSLQKIIRVGVNSEEK